MEPTLTECNSDFIREPFDFKENESIRNFMLDNSSILYAIFKVGSCYFDNRVPTAAVMFPKDEGEELQFVFNKDFWNSLTSYEQCFIVGHECLHIINEHGRQIFSAELNPQLANIASDIVVNHQLEYVYDFDRTLFENLKPENLCWVETVFPGRQISNRKSMMYYYALLEEEKGDNSKDSIDSHTQGNLSKSIAKEIVDSILENCSAEDIEKLQDLLPKSNGDGEEGDEGDGESISNQIAGVNPGGYKMVLQKKRVRPKPKWESVIKRWVNDKKKKAESIDEQWIKPDERLFNLNSSIRLPCEKDSEKDVREKMDIWFFQDTSGSCVSYADRFFRAAESIPTDMFNIRTFCFDTEVYEVDFKKRELQGFGGTAFDVIERSIQNIIKTEGIPYPSAVWIITDGYGNSVSPMMPERWYWFLTHDYFTFIPPASSKFKLKDYE